MRLRRITLQRPIFKTTLGQLGFLCLTSRIFNQFIAKFRLDNMIFMMYLDTYCRESVGNYCYKSGAQYVVTFPQPVHNFSFSLNSLSKSEFLSLGKPSGYYKIHRENKLTGEEIKKVMHFGRDRTVIAHGKGGWTEHHTAKERISIKYCCEGIARIKDDMICLLWDSLKDFNAWNCVELYRNPEATPELNNEYLAVTDFGIWALSVRLKE